MLKNQQEVGQKSNNLSKKAGTHLQKGFLHLGMKKNVGNEFRFLLQQLHILVRKSLRGWDLLRILLLHQDQIQQPNLQQHPETEEALWGQDLKSLITHLKELRQGEQPLLLVARLKNNH